MRQLADQISFLELSSREFDAGREAEAKRLAIAIRILVHRTPTSTPLLGQLGTLETMLFLNTAGEVNPRNVSSTWGLYGIESGPEGTRWVAFLDPTASPREFLAFAEWWKRPVTRLPGYGLQYSRSEYVLSVANTEGGAHVDEHFDLFYHALTRGNALGITVESESEMGPPTGDPVLIGVRQIAFELLASLDALEGFNGRLPDSG